MEERKDDIKYEKKHMTDSTNGCLAKSKAVQEPAASDQS